MNELDEHRRRLRREARRFRRHAVVYLVVAALAVAVTPWSRFPVLQAVTAVACVVGAAASVRWAREVDAMDRFWNDRHGTGRA